MTSGDRESLRRIAYGADASAEERAEAESALRELDEAERASAASVEEHLGVDDSKRDRARLTGAASAKYAADGNDHGDDEDDGDDDGEPPSFWKQSIRVAWLIPIVLGSLAVGYAATVGSLDAMGNAQNPTNAATPTPPIEATGAPDRGLLSGDLNAADAWFDRPYKASDAFPDVEALGYYGINPEDVRIAVNGGDKGSVWVGKAEGTLCLVIADPADGASASSCTDRDQFARRGIALSSTGLGATWFGREVMTAPLLGPTIAEPRVLEPRPGDLDAANSWFAVPALPSDEFPEPRMLAGLDIKAGDVRRVYPESTPWIRLWLAKQGNTGFCFLATDDSDVSSHAACARIDEFQTGGLAMTTQGYSFFWDGTSVTLTG